MVEVQCTECGNITPTRRYRVGKQKRFFCSYSCSGKAGMRAAHEAIQKILRSKTFKEQQSRRMKAYYAEYPEKVTRLFGQDNPAYRHGKAHKIYINFTKKRKAQIRQRDNHICQLCGTKWAGVGPKFDVHHIDYDKTNSSESNFITLCKSCHAKTHYKRNQWRFLFEKRDLVYACDTAATLLPERPCGGSG